MARRFRNRPLQMELALLLQCRRGAAISTMGAAPAPRGIADTLVQPAKFLARIGLSSTEF